LCIFTQKSVPVIFEPPCTYIHTYIPTYIHKYIHYKLQQLDNIFLQFKTKIQNKAHPKNNSGADWARDDEGIFASVPPERGRKVQCGNDYQSMDHILFHCEEINAQRILLKLQMGTWPASKEDLITKYKKEFFVFIESIDFDKLKV
jgi:hypothetical protein